MKKLIALVAALAVAGAALYLGLAVLVGTTTGGCPTALLQGTLVEQDGTLAVRSVPEGSVVRVNWPFGYGVGREDGTLTLTRVLVTVAREGDLMSVGGGSGADDSRFIACGPVDLGLTIPPEQVPSQAARARLTVTGIAHEPCIPPPSGCGYRVRLGSPSSASATAKLEHHRSYENAASGDPAQLTLGEGLPGWIEPGEYELVFEVEASSDAATPEPLDDGTLGYKPKVSVACTRHLIVPLDANAVMVDITFRGSTCSVAVSP
jgi:hypothetical protein